MSVYKSLVVSQLESFYGDVLTNIDAYPDMKTHLLAIAQRMWHGYKISQTFILKEISNYHPKFLGASNETLNQFDFSLIDCLHTVANEYGFKDWNEVEALGDSRYDFEFEKTVNALLEGDLNMVRKQITSFPRLLSTQSNYGHRATLLNYTASNGVEMWRQKVPMNLVEIVQYLLSQGADKNGKMKVYGGEFDTYSLLVSSAHPSDAGVMEEMKKVLTH